MAIDMHAHWVGPGLAATLRGRRQWPCIVRDRSGREMLDNGGTRRIALPEGFEDDIETRLRKMDEVGIRHGVLSLAPHYRIEWLPSSEASTLCRAFNDAMSDACRRYPDRFSALAALPLAEIDAARAEFVRAMKMPGMVGATLVSDGFLSLRRAERWSPVLEEADKARAILFVHYGQLPNDDDAPRYDTSDSEFVRVVTLDYQARLSANMVTFCLTNFLDRYPGVTVLSHNLGGNIPYEVERMDHRAMVHGAPGEPLPSERFRAARILLDCNSLGPRAIELATEVYGPGKIVFGSDGSMFGAQWTFDALRKARIPEEEKQAILVKNAADALDRVRRG